MPLRRRRKPCGWPISPECGHTAVCGLSDSGRLRLRQRGKQVFARFSHRAAELYFIHGRIAAASVHTFKPYREAPEPGDMFEHFLCVGRVQRAVLIAYMAQRQAAIAAQIDIPNLNIRFTYADIVLPREQLPQLAVAVFIMNGTDGELRLISIVVDGKQAQITHELRA